jgi:5-methyltetrahydrofolate--homocysteine methyltransferase
MMTKLQQLLESGKPIVGDGGMGTMLMSAGLIQGSASELWNIDKPDEIRAIHRGYIQAGAQIILTNSFGGNAVRLNSHGLGERVTELNQAAAQLARSEADAADHPVAVGGSIGPIGEFLEPLGTISFNDVVTAFEVQAQALLDGGVDLFWIETMSDVEEVRAAITACQQVDASVPIITTMTFDTKGRTMMGTKPEHAINSLIELGVTAVGANCGNGPDEIEAVIHAMHQAKPDAILIAKSNAGLPKAVGSNFVYEATPEDMAEYARQVQSQGARIIGACCGSTPQHIQAMAQALQAV